MSLSIRPAAPAELKRLAGFLPAWKRIESDESRVAEAPGPSRLVGWAILGQRQGDATGKATTYIDAAVLPRFRDGGALADLLAPLLQRAADLGSVEVFLATPRERTAPDLVQWEQLGFQVYRSLITYEFLMSEFAARTRATYERLRQRGSIPASAQVTKLTAEHWPAAVALLRAEKLIDTPMQASAEREGLHRYFCASSSIVTINGELKGVALNRSHGRQLETSALAVDPHLRGGAGWINAFLTWWSAETALSLGHETLTMSSDPALHPMTTRLAQRMGARELKAQLLLKKGLTNGENA